MGIFTRRKPKEEEQREFSYVSPYSDALMFGNSGKNNSSLSLSAVYSAVELISNSIATMPIQIKRQGTNGKDLDEGHSLNLVFGASQLTRFTLVKAIMQSLLLKGNGFAYIERAGDGRVIGLRYLPASDVQINYRKETKELYYTCSYVSKKSIKAKDMLHFLINSADGVTGISVLAHARRSLGIANSVENQAESFFSNGCNLSGILTVQGQLSEKQRQDIRASWQQAYGAGGNGIAILQGNQNYQPVSLNASDSQMLESRQFSIQDIARFFNISPTLLGDLSHSSYNTIEATNLQFLTYTIAPYVVMIEEELNRKLVGQSESGQIYINLDETALLKTDKTATASYYTTLLNAGVFSINEIRKELGYNPVEGGDKHLALYTKVDDNQIDKTNEETKNPTDTNQ